MKALKKGSALKKVLVALLVVGFFVFSSPVQADEITIVSDEWLPYCGVPGDPAPGYGIEVARKVFEAAGHTLTYKIVPWTRAVKETRKGKYNAIIGAYKEDAPDFVFPEEEFGISTNGFFGKKGCNVEYNGPQSLLGVKVGIIKDYSYGEELDKFFKANKKNLQYVSGGDPLLKNIKKLLKSRVDVVIEDPNVMNQKLAQMGVADQVVRLKSIKAVGDNRIYITFSPKIAKSKEYAEILTKGIRAIKKSGDFEKILAKYGLKYWK